MPNVLGAIRYSSPVAMTIKLQTMQAGCKVLRNGKRSPACMHLLSLPLAEDGCSVAPKMFGISIIRIHSWWKETQNT